jgi:hypothetical protein
MVGADRNEVVDKDRPEEGNAWGGRWEDDLESENPCEEGCVLHSDCGVVRERRVRIDPRSSDEIGMRDEPPKVRDQDGSESAIASVWLCPDV